MMKKELLLRNPLRILGHGDEAYLPEGSMGAVLAGAGVGKTALVVQLALSAMLQSKNVLHISLDQSIDKVRLWYEEMFEDITREYPGTLIKPALDETLPHRFIMTFKVVGFSVPKLEERLMDLIAQDIFHPNMIIVDGYSFDSGDRNFLLELKNLAEKHSVSVWFTARTEQTKDALPEGFAPISDLFDLVLQLEPKGADIHIQPLKGIPADASPHPMRLDPATMLICDEK